MRRLLLLLLSAFAAVAGAEAQQPDVQFPFPQIPELLQAPEARLAFLMENYWSRYDFDDRSDRGRETGEQGFADYINLLQYADSALAARSVKTLADSLAKAPARLQHFDELTDHYLGNPNSPLRNDVVYAHMLRGLTALPQLDEAARQRLTFRLRLVEKNQPGTTAADFAYIDRQGKRHWLHEVESELTLLVFSDPECEHCHEQMPRIIDCETLRDNPHLTVLNIYPDDNTEAWLRAAMPLPANWLEGRSEGGELHREQTYYLPALPSLYLLDRDKRVMVKDGTLEQVVRRINGK
ncbi:MAG: DUF5106 domain-containing protein [Prevotella sp.]|nr:DUF5106 domain-containing protein [Prevotella sp.]